MDKHPAIILWVTTAQTVPLAAIRAVVEDERSFQLSLYKHPCQQRTPSALLPDSQSGSLRCAPDQRGGARGRCFSGLFPYDLITAHSPHSVSVTCAVDIDYPVKNLTAIGRAGGCPTGQDPQGSQTGAIQAPRSGTDERDAALPTASMPPGERGRWRSSSRHRDRARQAEPDRVWGSREPALEAIAQKTGSASASCELDIHFIGTTRGMRLSPRAVKNVELQPAHLNSSDAGWNTVRAEHLTNTSSTQGTPDVSRSPEQTGVPDPLTRQPAGEPFLVFIWDRDCSTGASAPSIVAQIAMDVTRRNIRLEIIGADSQTGSAFSENMAVFSAAIAVEVTHIRPSHVFVPNTARRQASRGKDSSADSTARNLATEGRLIDLDKIAFSKNFLILYPDGCSAFIAAFRYIFFLDFSPPLRRYGGFGRRTDLFETASGSTQISRRRGPGRTQVSHSSSIGDSETTTSFFSESPLAGAKFSGPAMLFRNMIEARHTRGFIGRSKAERCRSFPYTDWRASDRSRQNRNSRYFAKTLHSIEQDRHEALRSVAAGHAFAALHRQEADCRSAKCSWTYRRSRRQG